MAQNDSKTGNITGYQPGKQITYRRTMVPWSEQVCAENIVEYWPGMNIGVPKADRPDF